MNKARIYRPTKNPMQSGKCKSGTWLLELVPATPYFIEGLMGWNGMSGTSRQVILRFSSKEAAINYATKKGLEFEVFDPNACQERRRAYADNFAFSRVRA